MTPEALARLHAQAIRTPRPWSASEFADLLARPETILSADPDGFAIGRAVAGEAELLSLVTAPAARRQGHARRHLAAFEGAAGARGATAAFLEVAQDNVAAMALYRGAGWDEVARRKDYFRSADRDPVSAIVMRKALAPE